MPPPLPTPPFPAKPHTAEQLQLDSTSHFGQRPCRWQSDIAFQLVHRRNLVSISATGSGKSFIFWLPMLYENGLTIIVVPLKNLGQQLADESSRRGFCTVSVTAELLGESLTLLEEIKCLQFRTVVLSPELAVDPRFMRIWNEPKIKKKINRVIIDEAHCVSQWGRDFRSSYLHLSCLHAVLGEVSWYLTSATLHSHVLQDTLRIIGLHRNTMIYCRSNDRPNIHLCVRKMKYSITSHLDLAFLVPLNPEIDNSDWVRQNIPQFLIYCNSQVDAESTALFLRSRIPVHARHRIVWYHSGMSDAFKKETIEEYERGGILGLCCTDACGMGLDLRRVRIVVQYRLLKKIDAIVQRFGRAGRDSSIQATAILLVEKTYF
ncbi:P-loop containing nucleoside triphosphate hydrolase protein, partial [Cantharellus anzutake]|uniref:P-loop containing nucleoside triphosphate hydrolase protein n=1 Tax=Cantharellus anzutake TaxID=1750568 RepID=UPI0019057A64